MTHDHPAAWPIERLLAECTSRRQRRSGPGGQHRNKVETAVVYQHTPSGIRGEASERRSQEENRLEAIFRLRVNLALEIRQPKSAVSELWKRRTKVGRIICSPNHDDFPALLAEALDSLAVCSPDPAPAAEHFGVSTSQLIKFLSLEHRALEKLNAARAAAGMHKLKS